MQRRDALRALLLMTALVAVGCAGGTSSPTASTTPTQARTADPSPATFAYSTQPNALVLSITTGGGFVPPSYLLTEKPQFALFGDGRVIIPGPQIEIYPGPLLPNLLQVQLTPADVQRVLGAASAAGLLGADAQFNAQGIMDAGTTTFVTTVEGNTHTISAYALGLGGTDSDEKVRQAREALVAFQRKMSDLSGFLGRALPEATYIPSAMRIFTSVAANEEPQGLTRQVVTWPLTTDPATGGETANGTFRCFAIAGADLAAFIAVAKTANTMTVWKAPTGQFAVSVRPLYPNESGCPKRGT